MNKIIIKILYFIFAIFFFICYSGKVQVLNVYIINIFKLIFGSKERIVLSALPIYAMILIYIFILIIVYLFYFFKKRQQSIHETALQTDQVLKPIFKPLILFNYRCLVYYLLLAVVSGYYFQNNHSAISQIDVFASGILAFYFLDMATNYSKWLAIILSGSRRDAMKRLFE